MDTSCHTSSPSLCNTHGFLQCDCSLAFSAWDPYWHLLWDVQLQKMDSRCHPPTQWKPWNHFPHREDTCQEHSVYCLVQLYQEQSLYCWQQLYQPWRQLYQPFYQPVFTISICKTIFSCPKQIYTWPCLSVHPSVQRSVCPLYWKCDTRWLSLTFLTIPDLTLLDF